MFLRVFERRVPFFETYKLQAALLNRKKFVAPLFAVRFPTVFTLARRNWPSARPSHLSLKPESRKGETREAGPQNPAEKTGFLVFCVFCFSGKGFFPDFVSGVRPRLDSPPPTSLPYKPRSPSSPCLFLLLFLFLFFRFRLRFFPYLLFLGYGLGWIPPYKLYGAVTGGFLLVSQQNTATLRLEKNGSGWVWLKMKRSEGQNAGFGPCFHLPRFHFGTVFFSHSRLLIAPNPLFVFVFCLSRHYLIQSLWMSSDKDSTGQVGSSPLGNTTDVQDFLQNRKKKKQQGGRFGLGELENFLGMAWVLQIGDPSQLAGVLLFGFPPAQNSLPEFLGLSHFLAEPLQQTTCLGPPALGDPF